MLTTVLGVAAVTSTVLRTWPQFFRIVVRKDPQGVSVSTWTLLLVNHVAWLAYGLLASIPVFTVSNAFAVVGCAATLWVLRSPGRVTWISATTAVVAASIYAVADGALLAIIVTIAIIMCVPQLVRVFRTSPKGVSVTAWGVSALSSIVWIAWATSISHPFVVAPHFFMLPAALAIMARTRYATSVKRVALE